MVLGSPGLFGCRCLCIIHVAYTWKPTVSRDYQITTQSMRNKMKQFKKTEKILKFTVPRLASAVTWSRGPRLWRGFTHGPQITPKCPLRVRMRPDHEHGNIMGKVDMERGPDSV